MKKKNKLISILLAICLAALLCVSLVACNDDSGKPNDNKPNDYESATYTVTFKTNGDTTLTNPVVKGIVSGTTVSEPRDSSGRKIIPVKRGHEFNCWSQDGTHPFDFTTPITSDITLTALYIANVYKHEPVLTAKLIYDDSTGKFSVDEDARDINDVALSAAETNPDTTNLRSTFGTTNSKLPLASANENKGEIGDFCFWYYIDDAGNPVQLSKWKGKDDTAVSELSSYNFTKALKVYPMFTDNLPVVTVKYSDSLSGAEYNKTQYVFGQNIPLSAMPTPDKNGYSFDYWYYVVKSKDKDGNEVREDKRFLFEDADEKNPTSPMDAAQSENNFKPVELVLYAKWTRNIKITSVDDFKAIYDELRQENPSDEQKKAIQQLLEAKISIEGELDFGTQTFDPLFDSEHVFTGTIDGAKYGENDSVLSYAKLKGGYFGNATHASVFGYSDGTIKNIHFENIGLAITATEQNVVYMGVATTKNGGMLERLSVIYTSGFDISYPKGIVFGGVTAINRGTSALNATIRLCTVNVAGFTSECEALTFGGIAGESNATASFNNCTVIKFEVAEIVCADDGIPQNGNSSLVMGGIAGINGSVIRLSTVTDFTVKKLTSLTEFVFGGVAGVNTGNLRVVSANVNLGEQAFPASVGGSLSKIIAAGGLIGKNEGYIKNCYCTANLFVNVASAPKNGCLVSVGGLVGSNVSDKKDSSSDTESGICAMNYCYSLGSINVTVADELNSVSVYAGGIAGRNSHKKIGYMFSTVNIKIDNDGEKNYAGKIIGKMFEDTATNGNIFFIENATIDANGNTETTVIGNVTEESNFHDGKWVTGADGGTSVIRFSGETWVVVEGGYPTFNPDVYK